VAMSEKTTVVCVLRSGGIYTPRWVDALRAGIRRWAPPEVDFLCLTDLPARALSCPSLALRHDWPGWWSKFEVFRDDVAEPGSWLLFMDLDIVPIGDLRPLLTRPEPIVATEDWTWRGTFGSAVMRFRAGSLRPLYDRFLAEAEAAQRKTYVKGYDNRIYGDQLAMEKLLKEGGFWPEVHWIQAVLPGFAFQPHRPRLPGPPDGGALACFWGKNGKPHDYGGWITALWQEHAAEAYGGKAVACRVGAAHV